MRRLVRIVVGIVLPLLGVPAVSWSAPGNGIDLTWNDCVLGTAGTAATNKNFHCTGAVDRSYDLIFQFKVNQELPSFVSLTADLELTNGTGVLSPFWHYEPGGCQRSGGSNPDGIAISSAIPASCSAGGYYTPWGTDGSEGIATIVNYTEGPSGFARWILNVTRTNGPTVLEAGANYYALHLVFNNLNRSTCAGCANPVELCWRSATLQSEGGMPAVRLRGTDKYYFGAEINLGGGTYCGTETPILPKSWGTIKAMYR